MLKKVKLIEGGMTVCGQVVWEGDVYDVIREYQTSKGSPVMALGINGEVILPMVPVEKVEVLS